MGNNMQAGKTQQCGKPCDSELLLFKPLLGKKIVKKFLFSFPLVKQIKQKLEVSVGGIIL